MIAEFPLPGVRVVPPTGSTLLANIVNKAGVAASTFLDPFGVSPAPLPYAISAPTILYVAGDGPWLVNGVSLSLEGNQVGTVDLSALNYELAVSNGAGDASMINAMLAEVSGGGTVKGKRGQNYVIDATVVIPSGVTFDISGCSLTRKASFTGFMLSNSAAYPLRTVTDAAISSTVNTTTLTSATAKFTAADVGRAVTVAGAGLVYSAAAQDLYTTIASVTNSTTAILSVAAQATVTNAVLSIYGRDSNIGIVGDASTLINAGNMGLGAQYYVNHLRRIDGLVIRGNGARCQSFNGAGMVFWSPGDITNFDFDDWLFTYPAGQTPGGTAVQICGPMTTFSITNVKGTTADDSVALQGSARGWDVPITYPVNDVQGNITQGYVGSIYTSSTTANLVKLFGGVTNANVDTLLRDIVVERVYGSPAVTQAGVTVESDRGGPTNADRITIRNVTIGSAAPAVQLLLLNQLTAGSITVENVTAGGVSGTSGARRGLVQVVHNARLTVRGVTASTESFIDLVQLQGSLIDVLHVDSADLGWLTTSCNIVRATDGTSIVNVVKMTGCRAAGTGCAGLVTNGSAFNNQDFGCASLPLLPTAIPGLVGWYKADALALANGNAVSSWTDSSGAGNTLVQATGALQPIYNTGVLNGLPGVTFDGSNDVMSTAGTLALGHVFVVAKYSAATFPNFNGLIGGNASGNTPVLVGLQGATTFGQINASLTCSYYIDGEYFFGNNTPLPATLVFPPGPMNAFSICEAAWTGFTNPLTLTVGSDRLLASRYWNGQICEIVVYSTPLRSGARQAVEAYLQAKWATPPLSL